MIRKLNEEDRQSVLKYLYQEPTFNIFIIGDIETFGFDKDFQTIYGEFDEQENYQSILLFYHENSVYYSHRNYFNQDYLKQFEEHKFHYLSGKEELINLIKPYLPNTFSYKPMYFCQATSIKHDVKITEEIREINSVEDLEKLYYLLVQIDEFGIKNNTLEEYLRSAVRGLEMGTKLYIEKDQKMVSTVATTADTTINAMVVGVATAKDYRQHGYASQLMIRLMDKYINHLNKSLCLFYDNPKAGKIYKRLGFEDIGRWVMMSDIER